MEQAQARFTRGAAAGRTLISDSIRELHDRLRRVLNRETISEVSSRSLIHANGFQKIVLGRTPEGQLRLHYWPAGRPTRLENPHNHRWDFASVILFGSYDAVLYECVAVVGGLKTSTAITSCLSMPSLPDPHATWFRHPLGQIRSGFQLLDSG